MKWWERLGRVMVSRNLSVEVVAERARVHPKSLYGYLKGDVDNPRGDVVQRLAGAVGMSEQDLRYENGPIEPGDSKRIPRLDMHKLGALTAAQDPLSTWDKVTFANVPADLPDDCWAMTLQDDSNAPEFRKGSLLIFHPKAPIEPGCYVVAVTPDDRMAHFGRFRPAVYGDTKRFTIVRCNPDYPDIEIGGKLKGFVLARAIKHVRDI
jgi:transcriptional regulator with XRE-family HTH domain